MMLRRETDSYSVFPGSSRAPQNHAEMVNLPTRALSQSSDKARHCERDSRHGHVEPLVYRFVPPSAGTEVYSRSGTLPPRVAWSVRRCALLTGIVDVAAGREPRDLLEFFDQGRAARVVTIAGQHPLRR